MFGVQSFDNIIAVHNLISPWKNLEKDKSPNSPQAINNILLHEMFQMCLYSMTQLPLIIHGNKTAKNKLIN